MSDKIYYVKLIVSRWAGALYRCSEGVKDDGPREPAVFEIDCYTV